MKKPIIMFDIDGVVNDNSSFFTALKTEYPTVDVYNLHSFNIAESLVKQGIIKSLDEHSDKEFFTKYAEQIFYEGHLKKGFLAFYNQLRASDQYQIVFVTARLPKEPEVSMTHDLFKRFGIKGADIHLVGYENKVDYLQARGLMPDILFEDKKETIEDAHARGVATFCVAYSYNEGTRCTMRIGDFTTLDMTVLANVLGKSQGKNNLTKVK